MFHWPKDIEAQLKEAVESRLNIVVAGPDEHQNADALNKLCAHIGENDRIAAIQAKDLLFIEKPYVMSLRTSESGSSDAELAKAALRMRMSRLIFDCVVDGGYEMAQAMCTGHDGSMAAVEGQSALEALESIADSMRKRFDLPRFSAFEIIVQGVDLVLFVKGESLLLGHPSLNADAQRLDFVSVLRFSGGETETFGHPWKQSALDKIEEEKKWVRETPLRAQKKAEKKAARSAKLMESIDHEAFFKAFSEKYGFNKWEQLRPLLKETVSIGRALCEDLDIPVGASKFGGEPDLPEGEPYPFFNEEVAHTFIAQFNCEELSKHAPPGKYPSKGMFYLFHLSDGDLFLPYEYDKLGDYFKTVRLIYKDAESENLRRTPLPDNEHMDRINAARISYIANLTIPQPSEYEKLYEALGFSEEELDIDGALCELHSALPRLAFESPEAVLAGELDSFYERPLHQFGGEPSFCQGAPEEDVKHALVNQFGAPEEAKKEWEMFLQLEVDDDLNLYWAGDGQMHYYAKKEDLENRKYSEIFSNMQCG